MNLDPRRVLAIRRRGLGDALVTLPAVETLAASLPHARVDLLVDRPFASLLERLANGPRILAWPPAEGGWLRRLRAANYDLVLDFLGSPRTALWTLLSGAGLRVGYDLGPRSLAYNLRVPRNRTGGLPLQSYAGEAFLDPLRSLGLPVAPWRPAPRRPEWRPADLGRTYRRWRDEPSEAERPRVGLMFSATWPAKAWPVRHGARLYRLLEADGWRPVFIPGPGDESIATALKSEAPDAVVAPPTSLLELAHLMSGLDLFVGTDCGARHLAVSLGLPTVTVFGPTNPRGWSPADPLHPAVATGEACSPCDLKECPVAGHPCLEDLAADRVLEAVRRVRQSTTGRADGNSPAGR